MLELVSWSEVRDAVHFYYEADSAGCYEDVTARNLWPEAPTGWSFMLSGADTNNYYFRLVRSYEAPGVFKVLGVTDVCLVVEK